MGIKIIPWLQVSPAERPGGGFQYGVQIRFSDGSNSVMPWTPAILNYINDRVDGFGFFGIHDDYFQ